jgi:hypothetical protein
MNQPPTIPKQAAAQQPWTHWSGEVLRWAFTDQTTRPRGQRTQLLLRQVLPSETLTLEVVSYLEKWSSPLPGREGYTHTGRVLHVDRDSSQRRHFIFGGDTHEQ